MQAELAAVQHPGRRTSGVHLWSTPLQKWGMYTASQTSFSVDLDSCAKKSTAPQAKHRAAARLSLNPPCCLCVSGCGVPVQEKELAVFCSSHTGRRF